MNVFVIVSTATHYRQSSVVSLDGQQNSKPFNAANAAATLTNYLNYTRYFVYT